MVANPACAASKLCQPLRFTREPSPMRTFRLSDDSLSPMNLESTVETVLPNGNMPSFFKVPYSAR